jgi:hypothetical protein
VCAPTRAACEHCCTRVNQARWHRCSTKFSEERPFKADDDDGVATMRSPSATSQNDPSLQTKGSVCSRPSHPQVDPGTHTTSHQSDQARTAALSAFFLQGSTDTLWPHKFSRSCTMATAKSSTYPQRIHVIVHGRVHRLVQATIQSRAAPWTNLDLTGSLPDASWTASGLQNGCNRSFK